MTIPRASIWPTVTFDTTRPDGMAAARAWVASLGVEQAPSAPQDHPTPEKGVSVHWGTNQATVTPDPELERLLDEEEEWLRRNSRTWPPPKPGTHESDLGIDAEWAAAIYGLRGGGSEYAIAAAWSRENAR